MDLAGEEDGANFQAGAPATLQDTHLNLQKCIFCAPRQVQEQHDAAEGKISTAEAINIFRARCPHFRVAKHPTLANDLAHQFGLSPRAIRDIWNLRTWWTATMPLWTAEDWVLFRTKYSETRMCESCKRQAVDSQVHQDQREGAAAYSTDRNMSSGFGDLDAQSNVGSSNGSAFRKPPSRQDDDQARCDSSPRGAMGPSLPTIGIWERLSGSIRETMDDAMAFLDETERSHKKRRT